MKYIIITLSLLWMWNTCEGQKDYNSYVFIAEECPISIYMVPDLIKLTEEFSSVSNFIMVFPMKKSSMESARKFLDDYNLQQFEIALDSEQKIATEFKAKITPEIVIEEASSGEILYRGRINDAYFAPGRKRHTPPVRDAQIAFKHIIENHQKAPEPWEKAIGCFITFHK